MRAILLAVLLTAGPALATQDGWPAIYDVAGVAADDRLNVRAAPSARSEILGTLAPDATGIEVIEATDNLLWGRVNLAEGAGWVSLGYMMRRGGQWAGRYPDWQSCSGTEPFWALSRADGGSILSRTGRADRHFETQIETGSPSRRDRFAFHGRAPDGSVVGLLRLEACSDGMSDRVYGIGLDLLVAGPEDRDLLSGCCSLAR